MLADLFLRNKSRKLQSQQILTIFTLNKRNKTYTKRCGALKQNILKTLKIPLLILSLILALLIVLYIKTDNQTADDFSLNLITEIVGIFLTVILIDLVLKRREQKEKLDILKNTYSQYRRPAQRLLSYFASIYKASTTQKPNEWNTDYKTLLSTQQFYEDIKYLDFLKPAPVIPTTDWVTYSQNQLTLIKSDLEKILDKYAFVLDSKIITDLEWIINHWLIQILSSGSSFKAADNSINLKRDNLCLLAIKSDDDTNDVKELINKVFEVAEKFKSITKEKNDIIYSDDMWRDDIAPKISDSRVS